jgi:hypothetical protein
MVYGGQNEFRELMERVKPNVEGSKSDCFSEKILANEGESEEAAIPKTVLERVANLEQIYY